MSALVAMLRRDGAPADADAARRALDAQTARGPDAQHLWHGGAVVLGHAMLATTTEDDLARQPFCADGGLLVVALDGRLDNRAEIAAAVDLPEHATSDVQLVAAAYARWGEAFARRLVGDFAVVLWDARRRELVCARDPLAARPLYVRDDGAVLSCASDPWALFAATGERPKPSFEAMALFLAEQYVERGGTLFRGVDALLPGSTLIVGARATRTIAPSWPAPIAPVKLRSLRDHEALLRATLREAVAARMRAKGRVAVHVSGGIDSSSVAALAAELARDRGEAPPLLVRCVFPGLPCDESTFSQAVADRLGLPIESVTMPGDLADFTPDAPRGSPNAAHGGFSAAHRVVEATRGAADASRGAADGSRGAADGSRGAADGSRGAADGSRGAADGSRGAADGSRGASDTSGGAADASRGAIDAAPRALVVRAADHENPISMMLVRMIALAKDRGARVTLTGAGSDQLLAPTGLELPFALLRGDVRAVLDLSGLRSSPFALAPYRRLLREGLFRALPDSWRTALRRLRRRGDGLPSWLTDAARAAIRQSSSADEQRSSRSDSQQRSRSDSQQRSRSDSQQRSRSDPQERSRAGDLRGPYAGERPGSRATWTRLSGEALPSAAARLLVTRIAHSADYSYSLVLADRIAGARGADLRHPFFDRRVIDLLLSFPDEVRAASPPAKALLRRAMGASLPDAVRDRTTAAEFSSLVRSALVAPHGDRLAALLRNGRLAAAGLIDPGAAAAVIDRARSDDDVIREVMVLAWLEEWLRALWP